MPNYKNSKIYKLWSPQGDDIYIGSTVNSLAKRKAQHKEEYIKGKGITSKILFEKYDDIRIELIEDFPCENRMELNKREGHYIRTLVCVNKIIPGRTSKEYFQDNKEKIKEYLEINKEHIKEYLENNREKIKERKHEWYEKNKEKIKEYDKQYRINNKEKMNERQRERRAKKKSLLSPVLSPEQPPE